MYCLFCVVLYTVCVQMWTFANNSWILQHDNAPAHTALSVREFLATKQITVLEHPAY